MDDFGMLARDFGFRPQGKSVPMAPSKSNVGGGSDGVDRRTQSSSPFNDVFGGPPKYSSANNAKSASSLSDFDYGSIFKSSSTSANDLKNRSSSPVYDKPVYDEDIFDGLPGVKSKSMSAKVRFDDHVFTSTSSPPYQNQNQNQNQSAAFDDLLGNLGRTDKPEPKNSKSSRGFDDLMSAFGDGSHSISSRPKSEYSRPQKTSVNSTKPTSDVMEDPFVVLESTSTPETSSPGMFTDPLEEIGKLGNSGNTKVSGSSVSGAVFDDIDPLDGFGKSAPAFSSEINNKVKDGSPSRSGSSMGRAQTSAATEPMGRSSFRNSESHSKKMTTDNFQEPHQTFFDMPSFPTDSHKSVGRTTSPSYVNANSGEINSQVDVSPGSEKHAEPSDDVWLTVSEIPLSTQPTSAPPPSRPPPPIPARASKSEAGFFTSNARKKGNGVYSSPTSTQYSQSPKLSRPPVKITTVSQIDELEDFAMGRTKNNVHEYTDIHSGEDVNTNSSAAAASAAAMKEAMDRAEAKFRHAKEVRGREHAKTARSKEAVQLENDEQSMQDDQEKEYQENQERLDRERRQREEEERERRRLERERERARENERERERARQAVERATREARERAAAEARERAAAELRLKAERFAVQKAQAEARERAAAEARERAEKAAAEARERANSEAREKAATASKTDAEARCRAERAAVERAAAEARERAAAEARERAAAARMNQQKNDNDLESFFSMGSRPSSAPRPRANTSDSVLDPQVQSKGGPEGTRRTSVSTSSNMRKASSTTNIVDDLTSIFGAVPSSGAFQEVEGETEERRRARLERHQRTQERAAKALAEKNQRDVQTLREQEERHRIAETLDVEIKRWAAGKLRVRNLRALLSTMQYVLWPECGWQPVSLTDLITGASVKKVYRKATLCIHPDKVQQKGATLQQKYVAEKVFDLLKEAWNKFNSEELF
ncbi:auxilin-related protein 2-like isoform X1 [Camellia sinensis]|uniref:auxilin-related protein 2-like isoform X1 n=1 Tax=Camellia sinensis TaxID=4442 RepID=UPI0010366029|nr:auxilin-related protein 2-like isoform X1 [Camellia sinensis]